MNSNLRFALNPSNTMVLVPQMHNDTMWMFQACTASNGGLSISVYEADQHKESPIRFNSESIHVEYVEELCKSTKTHRRLEVDALNKKATFIFIANHMDGIVSTDNLVLLVRSEAHQTIQLTVSKKLFL